jgi:hypothetical protein
VRQEQVMSDLMTLGRSLRRCSIAVALSAGRSTGLAEIGIVWILAVKKREVGVLFFLGDLSTPQPAYHELQQC